LEKVLLSVWQGASLLKVQPLDAPKKNIEPPKRGIIKRFSAASRRRLLRLMATIKREYFIFALFLTLTYPDKFPDMKKVKRDLDVFQKRVVRKFPKCAGVWRLEQKERQSGVNAGSVAPHFHILLFGVSYVDYAWLAQTWFEIVGSDDSKHLKAGTSVERVRNYLHAQSYVSKYMSKIDEDSSGNCGRFWGTFGDLEKFIGQVLGFLLEKKDFAKVARLLDKFREVCARSKRVKSDDDEKRKRKMIRYARKRKNYSERSANWFANSDSWISALPVLLCISVESFESSKI
jgi:Zn-finger nucleic acid-binding protein